MGHQKPTRLSNQRLQIHAHAIYHQSDDDGSDGDAGVPAGVSDRRLALEAVALRQQLAVYKRKQPRPKLNGFDLLFWVVVRRVWTNWSEALILVKPDTVMDASLPNPRVSGI